MIAGALALSSCGEDGASGGSTPVVVPPTPTPTPSPTPTQTAVTYPAASARLVTPLRGGAVGTRPTSSFDATGTGQSVTIGTDATYTVTDSNSPPAFTATTLKTTDATFRTYVTTFANGDPVSLTVFQPGATNPRLALSYADYALLSITRQLSSSASDLYQRFYTFGVRTTAGDLPTGTPAYAAIVDARWSDRSTEDTQTTGYVNLQVQGTPSFTITPGSSAVRVSFDATVTDAATSLTHIVHIEGTGTMAADGTISGTDTATGTTQLFQTGFPTKDVVTNYAGAFSGSFYGPGGAEVALTFQVEQTGSLPERDIVGVLVARRA